MYIYETSKNFETIPLTICALCLARILWHKTLALIWIWYEPQGQNFCFESELFKNSYKLHICNMKKC